MVSYQGHVGLSPTGALRQRVAELARQGVNVIDLSAGEIDDQTPTHIVAAAQAAAEEPARHHYGPAAGENLLRRAIATHEAPRLGIPVTEENVVVTHGGKQALFNALRAILVPGDEVLIPAPYWVTFPQVVRLAGGTPVVVPPSPRGLSPDVGLLRAAQTTATRAVIVNSPNNPTGVSHSDELIGELADWAASTGLWLIADEVYSAVAIEPSSCPATLVPEIASRLVVIGSTSKSYAMSGWRVGWGIAPEELTKKAIAIQSHTTSHVNQIAQAAALAALTDPGVPRVFRSRLLASRDVALGLLEAAGIDFTMPNGAFYVFPNIRSFAQDDGEFASSLLNETGVAVVPGSAFGSPGHVRISYSGDPNGVRLGMARFVEFARSAISTSRNS